MLVLVSLPLLIYGLIVWAFDDVLGTMAYDKGGIMDETHGFSGYDEGICTTIYDDFGYDKCVYEGKIYSLWTAMINPVDYYSHVDDLGFLYFKEKYFWVPMLTLFIGIIAIYLITNMS